MRKFFFLLTLFAVTLMTRTVQTISAQESENAVSNHRIFNEVPFSDVHLTDNFWAPRIETNRTVSAAHNIDWCENQTARIDNFKISAGLKEGEFKGIFFDDSDVYKVIEGLAYTLAAQNDPSIKAKTKEWIDVIAKAQQPDGYLMNYFIIAKPEEKWTNLANYHELYCAGHMAEAAAAWKRATGDDTFLNVNRKLMDLICKRYGPNEGQLKNVPGHEEIELALVKLYQLTGDEKYLKQAKFFIDIRGVAEGRETELFGEYCQDHKPLREQSEIVGHAVRAMYLFSGATDVAGYYQDQELMAAMNRLWDNVTLRKMYLTGGIGSDRSNEGFRDEYYLPNQSAYAETCAAIGLVLWAHRMNLATGEARFADVMEQALYNGVISGYGLSGDTYFYVNPLASEGNHHREPFFGCACCPTNVIRMIASLPSYVYATSLSEEAKASGSDKPDTLVVNLFVQGTAEVELDGVPVEVTQTTAYPYDGDVQIQLRPQADFAGSKKVKILVRKPEAGRYIAKEAVLETGKTAPLFFGFEMIPRRIAANPKVEADRGLVALKRGPLVYCFEECDNEVPIDKILVSMDPDFKVEMKKGYIASQKENDPTANFADRDVPVISVRMSDRKRAYAIPYCVWDNRKPGKMSVWVPQVALPKEPDQSAAPWDEASWTGADGKAVLYKGLDGSLLTEQ